MIAIGRRRTGRLRIVNTKFSQSLLPPLADVPLPPWNTPSRFWMHLSQSSTKINIEYFMLLFYLRRKQRKSSGRVSAFFCQLAIKKSHLSHNVMITFDFRKMAPNVIISQLCSWKIAHDVVISQLSFRNIDFPDDCIWYEIKSWNDHITMVWHSL